MLFACCNDRYVEEKSQIKTKEKVDCEPLAGVAVERESSSFPMVLLFLGDSFSDLSTGQLLLRTVGRLPSIYYRRLPVGSFNPLHFFYFLRVVRVSVSVSHVPSRQACLATASSGRSDTYFTRASRVSAREM